MRRFTRLLGVWYNSLMSREFEDRKLKPLLQYRATRHAHFTLMEDGRWLAWEDRDGEVVELHTGVDAHEILVALGDGYSSSVDIGAELYNASKQKGESDDTDGRPSQTVDGGTR